MARQFNLIPPVCEQAEHHPVSEGGGKLPGSTTDGL